MVCTDEQKLSRGYFVHVKLGRTPGERKETTTEDTFRDGSLIVWQSVCVCVRVRM